MTKTLRAKPVQASLAWAAAFSAGALILLLAGTPIQIQWAVFSVSATSLVTLVALGAVGASTGNAPIIPGALRVGV
jgi:hypothetical protein